DTVDFERTLGSDLTLLDTGRLTATIEAWRGDFLAGLTLAAAAEFELWLLGERARLQNLYHRGLDELVRRLLAAERYEHAVPWVKRRLQSEPLLEETHARLMWLYARTGQTEAAPQQFERCQELLRRELAAEPS